MAGAGTLLPRAARGGQEAAPSAPPAPALPVCVGAGDVSGDRAVVWARAERPSRMVVEYATGASFDGASRIEGPAAGPDTDLTARVELTGLPAGQRVSYRVTFEPLDGRGPATAPVAGSFRTPPAGRGGVSFAWGGDVAGQGWGIDPARGGFTTFASLRRAAPDVFIHSGDSIYADGPIKAEVALADGSVWRNLVTPEKDHVAETLADFRGNYRYNLLDEHLRGFFAEVPWAMQWDDHEVLNNWYPGETHTDERYGERRVDVLARAARQAFLEYAPVAPREAARGRIYRVLHYGPSLDVFVLDLRSHRGPNSPNKQARRSKASAILGVAQLAWLEEALSASRATWKVVASDMPIGLVVPDGDAFDAVANRDDGVPLGREHEIAHLLASLQRRRVRNVLWVTADVHYAAAHHYHPERARFRSFSPFWEFVAGPLHAGTFKECELDATFGPEVKFVSIPKDMKPNRPPSEGLQFFGLGRVAAGSETLTVSLHDRDGRELYAVNLDPAR